MALALFIFLAVFFTQIVSWIGASVLNDAVRRVLRVGHDCTVLTRSVIVTLVAGMLALPHCI